MHRWLKGMDIRERWGSRPINSLTDDKAHLHPKKDSSPTTELTLPSWYLYIGPMFSLKSTSRARLKESINYSFIINFGKWKLKAKIHLNDPFTLKSLN